ncbi:MAG TPA: FHA domain-containing protein [Acidimicrobiales bacterium]|nr:FHA domain-containing protein [Acidimicrobiales bacterium]
MSHGLLDILRFFLLALIWLFFLYAARMVLVEVRRSRAERATTSPDAATPALPDRATDRKVALRLRVVEPPERRGRTYDLRDEVTVGRSPGCAVYLEGDSFASSVHARVFRRNGELWVEDLGSTNGTYLNEERLASPTRLQRGDRVKVGATVLEVAR